MEMSFNLILGLWVLAIMVIVGLAAVMSAAGTRADRDLGRDPESGSRPRDEQAANPKVHHRLGYDPEPASSPKKPLVH